MQTESHGESQSYHESLAGVYPRTGDADDALDEDHAQPDHQECAHYRAWYGEQGARQLGHESQNDDHGRN